MNPAEHDRPRVTYGPYTTREQAEGESSMTVAAWGRVERMELLTAACRAARVEVGAFDGEVLSLLSRMDAQTCQVVAGLIRRAYAGPPTAGDDFAQDYAALLPLFDGGQLEQRWQALQQAVRGAGEPRWRDAAAGLADVLTEAAARARRYAYGIHDGRRPSNA